MRITGTGLPEILPTGPVHETARKDEAGASAPAPELQSAVLQPALAALRDLPDIDQAKVEALRDALARGEVTFNASRLAGLIERFHGNRE